MRYPLAVSTSLALTLLSPLAADEFRLTDGRVIVGAIKKRGDEIQVRTRTGEIITFAAADVTAHRTDEELRAALREIATLSDGSAHRELGVAATAFRFGLTSNLWKHLDRCVEALAADPEDGSAVSRRCADLLAQLEPELLPAKYRDAKTRIRVRALLRRVRISTGPGMRAAVAEILAREPNGAAALREATERDPLHEHRLLALEALARQRSDDGQRALCRAIVRDEERDVRVATADLIHRYGDPRGAIRYLAPGFLHPNPNIRGRTAQAYGHLDVPEAIDYLVAAGPLAGVARADTGQIGVRAHMFQIEHRAYIRDFEVEIAQAAAVANPIIGAAQQGVVLDVTVGGTYPMTGNVVQAYRNALRKLTGQDPGPEPSAWSGWWARQQKTQPSAGQGGR